MCFFLTAASKWTSRSRSSDGAPPRHRRGGDNTPTSFWGLCDTDPESLRFCSDFQSQVIILFLCLESQSLSISVLSEDTRVFLSSILYLFFQLYILLMEFCVFFWLFVEAVLVFVYILHAFVFLKSFVVIFSSNIYLSLVWILHQVVSFSFYLQVELELIFNNVFILWLERMCVMYPVDDLFGWVLFIYLFYSFCFFSFTHLIHCLHNTHICLGVWRFSVSLLFCYYYLLILEYSFCLFCIEWLCHCLPGMLLLCVIHQCDVIKI